MTTPTQSAEIAPSAPPLWRRWLAYVAIATMPYCINMERVVGPGKRPNYRSAFDYLLWLLTALMIVDLIQRKPWSRIKFPQLSTVIWAFVAIASYFWLQGGAAGMAAWPGAAANPLIVVMLSSWVFSNLGDDPAEFRKFALILCGSLGVCVLIAFYQYIGPVGVPYNPNKPDAPLGGVTNLRLGGWYDNRMLFAAQAAMFVPAAAAFAALDKDPMVKAVAAALGVLALCVTMAVGGFLGAVAGVLAVAAACLVAKKYVNGFALLIGALIVVAIVIPNLPAKRGNAATLLRGIALFAKPDPAKDDKVMTPRLRRYQAALDFLGTKSDKGLPNWILGAGAGRLTPAVNDFYDSKYYPKPSATTDNEARFDIEQDERDGFGLLEKTGVELGAVGLAALAFFFAAWLAGAAGAFLRDSDNGRRLLALASLGACIGAAVVSVFAFPTQRAASGGTLAFFFGLSMWLNAKA